MSPSDKQQRLDRFIAAHREKGLPITNQRRSVFEAVLGRDDHPTTEQVYRAVRVGLPQISRMTVHRILGTFVSLGLLSKTCHPGSSARFDPKLHQHHHLVCLDCGEIFDFEDPRLNQLPWPDVARPGFQIEDYHIHFRGRCARCRQKLQGLGDRRQRAHRLRSTRKKSNLERSQVIKSHKRRNKNHE